MRLFFSHSTDDKSRVNAIAAGLPAHVKPWLDVHQLGLGEELDDEIRHALEDCHAFVVFLSRSAMEKPWVVKETAWALSHERALDRVLVLPVLLETGLDLASAGEPFGALAGRLHLQACDASAAGDAAASVRLGAYLFHWLSEWMEAAEPPGGGHRRFVTALERDLVTFKTRLYELKAVMAWPLEVLVTRPDALAMLVSAKDRYNAYTEAFIPRLAEQAGEVRERFGPVVMRVFAPLAEFVERDVYRGTAYALNDVIESINRYDSELQHDPVAFAAAESRRAERVAALQPVLDELSRRTSDIVGLLK